MLNKLYILITLIILVFIIIKIQVYFKTVENFAYGIEYVNNYIFSIQDNTISKQQDGDYHYLKFLHTGGNQTTYTLTLYNDIDIMCDILIVGGGGGGGSGMGWVSSQKFGGGGGGGGVVYLVNQILNAGTYKINVGRGGYSDDNGKDSSITYNDDTYVTLDSIELQGKGGGKGWRQAGDDSVNRGSGGGAKNGGTVGTQGLTFWNGTTCNYEYGGHEATSSRSGGGAGAPADVYGAGIGREVNITNESLYFGAGGQGAEIQQVIQGGGGKGGIGINGSSGFNGMPNTGGGGGGGFGQNDNKQSFRGGSGGSGIVIIRLLQDPLEDFNEHIVLWHDSQNIDGQNNTTLSDTQLITDWFDKSGSGFTTTSTDAFSRPEFNESENALYFDGSIIVTNINLNSYLTLNIFFVWKPTVPNELLHGLWDASADLYNRCFWISGPEFDWFHDTPAPPNLIVGSGRDHEVIVHEQDEDFITNNIYIVNTEYNRELQPGKVYINNNEKAAFTSGALDTGTTDPSSANYSPSTTFGMARTKYAKADDFFMYGNIYEIIVINRLLTNAERLKIYNYLNNRCRS